MSRSSTTAASFAVTAVVPPGLEEPAAAELQALGAAEVRPLRRAVACRTDLAGFYRLHLRARLPFRFLRELARFPCHNRRELRRGVQAAADWELWLPPQRSFRVEASGSLPELNHSHYTALEVKNALVDLQRQAWGERSTVDLNDPDLCLHLHLSPVGGGLAILSLEGGGTGGSGGGSLHRRGYRAAMGLAPLKENLAAGLIALTGWDGSVPLVDPLCGSGTLLLEAASMAMGLAPGLEAGAGATAAPAPGRWGTTAAAGATREAETSAASRRGMAPETASGSGPAEGIPPAGGAGGPGHAGIRPPTGERTGQTAVETRGGQGDGQASTGSRPGPDATAAAPRPRPFGFRRWPDFDVSLWNREVAAAAAERRSGLAGDRPLAPILGLERDPQVLEQARANAAAAGLADRIELRLGDFRELQPPPGPGVLVCNPPYGMRLGAEDDLEGLYGDLGRMARQRCPGWTLWLLSGNPALSGALRLKASRRIAVSNGGIDCRWLRYELR